jgi:hypothetical protein
VLAYLLLALFLLTLIVVAHRAPARDSGGLSGPPNLNLAARPTHKAAVLSAAPPNTYYRHHSAGYWAWQYRIRTRQLQAARARLRSRWQPTVRYALRLASAVTGVAYTQLAAVAWCESTHNPWAANGRYRGLFQLGWAPFGMSPYDPVANALSAALTVRHDGSWRQWECRP